MSMYYKPRNKTELIEQIARSGYRERRKLRNLPVRILWGVRKDMLAWFESRHGQYSEVIREVGRLA